MRRWLWIGLLVVGFSSVAAADVSGLAVRSLRFPLRTRAVVQASSEDSCSQSSASTNTTATLSLRITRSGRATLELDRIDHFRGGPSYGAYRAGDRSPPSFVTSREVHSFRGRAERRGQSLELLFTRDRTASARVQGHGEPSLPPAESGATSLRLLCSRAEAHIFPATGPVTDPSTAERADILQCTFPDGAPAAFSFLEARPQTLYFGRGPGILTSHSRRFGAADTTLRLPPPP